MFSKRVNTILNLLLIAVFSLLLIDWLFSVLNSFEELIYALGIFVVPVLIGVFFYKITKDSPPLFRNRS